jgi:UDP-N-acetylglucosamine acyltransferase
VHQFCKVGAHAFIAGGAMVRQDVPPYVMVQGDPAEPYAVNSEGLKRRGFTEDQIRAIREAYRVLYRSDLKLAEARARLAPIAAERPEIKAFADFIQASTRSIVR